MKKNYLLGAMAAGMLLFTACSNDEDIANVSGNDDATQAFVLKVASSGDGVTTRAGRPLESSEAKQSIENVKIIVCEGAAVKYVTSVSDWNKTGSTPYTAGGHGREKTIEIPKESKLTPGTYTVYAFGYSTGSDYDLKKITDIADGATSGTFDANTTLSFKDAATNKIGEEIFAGSLSLTVTEGKGFKSPVVLNRQVAGTFGYVKDIPFITDGVKLRLVASAKNSQLVLGQFGNFDLTGNGTGNDGHINYVVNGTGPVADKVIYDITLTDWFTSIKDDNNDGIIDAGANWKGNATKYAEGSAFAGEFLIPFSKQTGTNTFTLELTKTDNTVLRSWTVKLPTADGQLSSHDLYTWNTDFVKTTNTDTNTEYNVVRNHLYGIGKRTLDEPTNPGTDPDEPESLNTKQELTLRVNDNWEVVHNMDIE